MRARKSTDLSPADKITAARIRMVNKARFFAILSSSLQVVIVEPDHPYLQTAGTDGVHLYINPLFFSLLDEDGQEFVIAHEVMHIVGLTLKRKGNRQHLLWNCATDFANNLILEDSKFKMPTQGDIKKAIEELPEADRTAVNFDKFPEPEKVIGLLDRKYDGWTAEQIYEDLLDQQKEMGKEAQEEILGTLDQHVFDNPDLPQNDGGQGENQDGDEDNQSGQNSEGQGKDQGQDDDSSKNGGGNQTSGHQQGQDQDDNQGSGGKKYTEVNGLGKEGMSEKMAQRWKARINNAMAQGAGDVPMGVRRMIEEMNEPAVDWRSVIQSKIVSQKIGDYSWVPPDSRLFGGGITLPDMNEDVSIDIAAVIDASGSMSESDIRDCVSELKGICDVFQSWTITYMSFDHDLYDVQTFSDDSDPEWVEDLRKEGVSGGGGTSFAAPLRYLAGQREFEGRTIDRTIKVVVFFTDGYPCDSWQEDLAGYFEEVIWLITPGGYTNAPYGTVVTYDRYN